MRATKFDGTGVRPMVACVGTNRCLVALFFLIILPTVAWSQKPTPSRSSQADQYTIKMNVDTDTQYAFTRPVAGHMFSNYDGVLKIDGEVGRKKAYDPRTWGKAAEESMTARVVRACEDLMSAGKRLT